MKQVKRVPKTVAANDAVFVYTSLCCSAPAAKPACVITKGQRVGEYVGAKPEGEASLGSWRCGACRKPCFVLRSNKPKDVPKEGVSNV